MTIYTDDPGKGINQPLSNAPSGMDESFLASFQQGFREGPLNAFLRLLDADRLAADPDSVTVSKQEADSLLAEYGIKSIRIPDNGVTHAYLDHVIDERRQSLARQQIVMSAPDDWYTTPLNFVASLAGAMADPGNAALAFVPFAGEAKAASLLGRTGQRFIAGAKTGVVQAVATIPLTAQAAAAEGEAFTPGNALESTFFNTVAGALMHAGGGLISDAVKSRLSPSVKKSTDETVMSPAGEAQPAPVSSHDNIPERISIPESGTNVDLPAATARDLESYAYSRAYNDVVSEYLSRQQATPAAGTDSGAALTDNTRQDEEPGARPPPRSADDRSQDTTFREAGSPDQKSVQTGKETVTSPDNDISDTRKRRSADAEQVQNRVSQTVLGEIPGDLKESIRVRAQQIKDSMQMSPAAAVRSAASVVQEAHWSINQQAYRAALAHMMEGRSPGVEPFYELHNPELRERAIQRIRDQVTGTDESVRPLSESADRVWRDTLQADHELRAAEEDLENEFSISEALLNDIQNDNPELAESLRENMNAIRREADDNSPDSAFRAFAACMINRGLL